MGFRMVWVFNCHLLLRRAWEVIGYDCSCIQGGKLGESYENKGCLAQYESQVPRSRRTYIAPQAPVGEDANKYGLAWSQLINGDPGEESCAPTTSNSRSAPWLFLPHAHGQSAAVW